jgi:hypothetical protein
LIFLEKKNSENCLIVKVLDLKEWRLNKAGIEGNFSTNQITGSEWNFAFGKGKDLISKLQQIPTKLSYFSARIFQGPITSADSVFLFKKFSFDPELNSVKVLSKELNEWISIEKDILKPVVRSGDIDRYHATPSTLVLFPYSIDGTQAKLINQLHMKKNFPLAWEYLCRNRKLLEQREKGKFKDLEWYRFGRTQNLGMWEQSTVGSAFGYQ